jgi:NitT/TauT family transport system ATP-binding protein
MRLVGDAPARETATMGETGPPLIRLRDVRKIYRAGGVEHLAVSEASFDVHAGELVSLVGPSGCGKTTLLKIVAGLHGHDGGEVTIGAPATSAWCSSRRCC